MRRAISIFAAAACGLAFSATVPQRSASDYYFSRPNLPSNVTGRVMGVPPAYSVMRSEDVAWLREAYCERAALLSRQWAGLASNAVLRAEYGKWPLSATNRFARWTIAAEPTADGGLATNVIVGYNWTTNLGSGVDSATIRAFTFDDGGIGNVLAQPDGGLPTDASLYRSAAADVTALALTGVTNVWRRATVTNFWTNATCRIEMQMTNGTVSVVTNAWLALAPATNETVVTNVRARTYVDLVFSDGVAGCYTNVAPNGGRWSGTYRAAVVTNLYTWLDGMRRLSTYGERTNRLSTVRTSWYNGDTTAATNTLGRYEYTASYLVSKNIDGEDVVTTYDDYGSYERPDGTAPVVLMTSFTTNAICAGGDKGRLSGARIYAVANVEYSEFASSDGPTTNKVFATNEYSVVVIPAGSTDNAVLDRLLSFVATVDVGGLCETAVTEAGHELRNIGWHPSLVFPVPEPSEDSSSSSFANVSYKVSLSWVLVVDFEPWTKMPIGGQ